MVLKCCWSTCNIASSNVWDTIPTSEQKSSPTEAITVLNASMPVKLTEGQLCRYMYIGVRSWWFCWWEHIIVLMCWRYSITVDTLGSYISEVDQRRMRAMNWLPLFSFYTCIYQKGSQQLQNSRPYFKVSNRSRAVNSPR